MEPNKEIIIGSEGRKRVKAGMDKAANAVRPTLGVIGMGAMIEWPGLDPIEADDGKTILNNLKFRDRHEQLGLQKIRKAALRTSAEGGDGTASTTVITQALVAEAFAEVEKGAGKTREVRERLDTGLQEVMGVLSGLKRDVKPEEIEDIAFVSSLDKDISKLIAEVIREVGTHGTVEVQKGGQLGYFKEVVPGAKFGSGYVSEYFVNDFPKMESVLENPFIVLVDRRITTGNQVKKLMDEVGKTGVRSVLFIADDVDGLGLASLAQSSKSVKVYDPIAKATKQGTYDVCAVKNPFTASPGRDFLKDMAALTGATVISEEAGMRLDDQGLTVLGQAEKVVVGKDFCKIIGGKGTLEAIGERAAHIKGLIDATTSEYEKKRLQDRLAMLTGGIGVIRVGTYTDTDYNAKKYKFDNGIAACQAALAEGIVPGGGVALAIASFQVKEPMFKRALMAPFEQMAKNAGMDDARLESRDEIHTGFNFKTREKVNMFEAGIIDPLKVVRLALESAAHIASTLVGMEVFITNEDEPDGKAK